MYAALTWLLSLAAARRAPLEVPTAAPLPFRAPGVLPVDAEPHTAAAAVGDLRHRLTALKMGAAPQPSNLAAPAPPRANFYESAGFCPAPADEPAAATAPSPAVPPVPPAAAAPAETAEAPSKDPLDAVRASLARTAALTKETTTEPPDPVQEVQRKAALKAMREREAKVAQFFDFAPPVPGSKRPAIRPREPSFAARQTRRAEALRRQRSAVVDVSKSPSAAPAAFDGAFEWSDVPAFDGAHGSWSDAEETATEATVPAAETAPAPARPVPADFTETARILYDPTASATAETAPAPAEAVLTEPAAPSTPQVSFAGLLLALALALSLPLCVVALAASAFWRRRAPPVIETRETPINERYATRTEPASELVEMDAATRRVHREARAASLEAEKLRKILHRWRDSPRRPSVASLLKARRDLRASKFQERQNRFDRDDAVVAETPLVKEVRFDARTPASAIVSESDGDSPVVASPPRKLYMEAPPVRNRSAILAWVLLAAFVARDLAPRRQAPAPTPRPSMEPTYVRAPPDLVDDVAMVPAIAMAAPKGLRPLAIAKAALAPMAISATVLAVLPPRLQAALGLHALHALDRLRRLAVAAVAFVARKRRRAPTGAQLRSAMHFSAP
ncbi:unnamed protein product [Pelagomonas calceolata]|uniref:Uncharacterized protein n=2 Tax=Pelagomonas calceolata TaxID=35677 RepID=A0A8J2X434_9STRA|nr:unnamed protein product [Pelagomonas calceolata]